MPPAARCQSQKLWVAARHVERQVRCDAAACRSRISRKLQRSLEKLETALPCLTRDDAETIAQSVRRLEADVAAVLRGVRPECASLLRAATAHLAGAVVDGGRPTDWPPTGRHQYESRRAAADAFDREREAAKEARGCRSVTMGPKLHGEASGAARDLVRTLLPPAAATGIALTPPPGWHLYDSMPGRATLTTLPTFLHGGFMPEDGAALELHNVDQTVSRDAWFALSFHEEDEERLGPTTVDGVPATRALGDDSEMGRSLYVVVRRGRIAHRFAFAWYPDAANAAAHREDFERLIATARFLGGFELVGATPSPTQRSAPAPDSR